MESKWNRERERKMFDFSGSSQCKDLWRPYRNLLDFDSTHGREWANKREREKGNNLLNNLVISSFKKK